MKLSDLPASSVIAIPDQAEKLILFPVHLLSMIRELRE
ncbi:hypothetical protein ASZ90_005053 [hydrocarbon metagenome]|uniref:Uncharacterized protein n=1 Tax=hydrocarbon metagenome TaxID=938273 RepID=A0A0W8FWA9_9ZZZZ